MLSKRKADAISNDTTNIHTEVPLQNDVLIKLHEWDIGLYSNISTDTATSITTNADSDKLDVYFVNWSQDWMGIVSYMYNFV